MRKSAENSLKDGCLSASPERKHEPKKGEATKKKRGAEGGKEEVVGNGERFFSRKRVRGFYSAGQRGATSGPCDLNSSRFTYGWKTHKEGRMKKEERGRCMRKIQAYNSEGKSPERA